MYPVFAHAWICDTDQPTVIVHSGVTDYGVRLDVYEGDECWVSGDGDLGDGNVDLLEALRFALDTWLPGTSGVALNSDGKIEVTYSGTATIRWGHEDTTLDPNVFGFLAEDVAISSTPSEAPYQSPLIWTPDRWATRDTGDVPDMIAANRVTGNGLARGYRMTTGFKRAIDFDLLPLTKVQLDDPERPFSTFYRVVQDWAEGRKIRVYDDQDDMPSGVFRAYRWAPGSMPEQQDTVAKRYSIPITLRKDTTPRAVTHALRFGTPGFATYYDADAYDVAQVFDSASSVSISCWVNITDTDSQTIISRMGSIGSYQIEVRIQDQGSGNHIVDFRVARNASALTLTTYSATLAGAGWRHLVFVFDGAQSGTDKIACYFDGEAQTLSYSGTYDMTALPSVPSLDMRVGSWLSLGGTWPLIGDLDDLAIWRNVALSASEVAALFALGQDANIRDVAATRPALWWRFEQSLWADLVAAPLEPNTASPLYVEVT